MEMFKKAFIPIILIIIIMLLSSCEGISTRKTYVDENILIIDKYTAINSRYNFWLEKYKTYTAYYFVLENGDINEVDNETYYKYKIGDYYTIQVLKNVEAK